MTPPSGPPLDGTAALPQAESFSTISIANVASRVSPKRKREASGPVMASWSETVRVLVGPEEQEFIVHPHFLRRIPFFRVCLEIDMVEKQTRVIRLPEDKPEVFNNVLVWAYTGTLPFDLVQERDAVEAKRPLTQDPRDESLFRAFGLLLKQTVNLYVLAQKLMFEPLQNHIVDTLRNVSETICFGDNFIRDVVERLPATDKLLDVAKQLLARDIQEIGWALWTKTSSFYQNAASQDLESMKFTAEALARFGEGKIPTAIGQPCDYHVHIDTPKCQSAYDGD